jgi:hypothetical protein
VLRWLPAVAAAALAVREVVRAGWMPVELTRPLGWTLGLLVWGWFTWESLRNGFRERGTPPEWSGGAAVIVPAALAGYATSWEASPVTCAILTAVLWTGLVSVVVRSFWPAAPPISRGDEVAAPLPTFTGQTTGQTILQTFDRHRAGEQTETIRAELLAEFAAGQREMAVHLPIHPPLPAVPRVECEPLADGEQVTARASVVRPFGVRIEVRRHGPVDHSLSVPVGLLLTAAPLVARRMPAPAVPLNGARL